MSAAAGLAKQLGYEVTGSDSKELYEPAKGVLDKEKIPYFLGYDAKNISASKADLFIASSGEDLANPEMEFLEQRKIPYYSFAELLAEMNRDKLRIVVTGTHGKSTTAAILGYLLQNLDNSSFMTGGVLRNYNLNFHFGTGHYAVFEGDEYKALWNDSTPKFHYYKPDILVLTNLEFDHPDLFFSLEELKQEFQRLIENMPEDGLIVYNADDVNLSQLVYKTNVASVGFAVKQPAEFQAQNLKFFPETSFELKFKNKTEEETVEQYSTGLPGLINVYNSTAALAALRTLGFSAESLMTLLQDFQGLKRRFEIIGEKNGITIIDDYAHHPTEVRETLLAARSKFPDKRIWAVFEPHTFSRTKATLNDLAQSFAPANKVLIAEIYPARENLSSANITSKEVMEEVSKYHKDARLVKNKQQALNTLIKEVKTDDVVIIMAVGNFNTLAQNLIQKL